MDIDYGGLPLALFILSSQYLVSLCMLMSGQNDTLWEIRLP